MLLYDSIAFHNVVELQSANAGGLYLQRLPQHVRDALSPLGRMVAQESAGCEIRFVTESPSFRITLGALPSVLGAYEKHTHDVMIFRGGFFHSRHTIEPGKLNHINVVSINQQNPFEQLAPPHQHACGFDPRVWRIFLGRYPAVFHSLDTYGSSVRPPAIDELPSTRWLAYGSSITCAAGASLHHLGYIYHAARRLAVDVINQGLSGSCCCETAMTEYLARRDDWDIITLEIGVNMRSGLGVEEFRRRARDLIDTIRAQHPHKPIALISIFPNAASRAWTSNPQTTVSVNEAAFNDVLHKLVADANDPAIRLLQGGQILQEAGDLTMDLIHPSDYGHAAMGAQLAQLLGESPQRPSTFIPLMMDQSHAPA